MCQQTVVLQAQEDRRQMSQDREIKELFDSSLKRCLWFAFLEVPGLLTAAGFF